MNSRPHRHQPATSYSLPATVPPPQSTILSYFEIAPLLAEQVLVVESRIYSRDFLTSKKVPALGTFFLPYKPNALILK